MIKRKLFNSIKNKQNTSKAIIITGPRQVGKTTLIKELASDLQHNYLFINGDDPEDRLRWQKVSLGTIKDFIGKNKVVVFDEAQRIENIGLTAKMIIDNQMKVQVFISGSSAIEVSNSMNEPLTGRKWEFNLYPFSFNELADQIGLYEQLKLLDQSLIYGSYPEVVNHPQDARDIIMSIATSYLYKDVLELNNIKKPEVLYKLLKALAWQVGSEVSISELSNLVQVDKNTVNHYIDLLEKAFVIFRLMPLSNNPRKEISTSRKIYFYDNGIRNAIINEFKPIASRNDVGALWENYFIAERKKYTAYNNIHANTYFWRSKLQAEIDYVEEIGSEISAYELKWNEKAKARFSKTFTDFYKPIHTFKIHNNNYWEHLR